MGSVLMPFNSDTFLAEEFLRLRDKYDIKHVVETGTFKGATTLWLSQNFESVETVEINKIYFDEAAENLKECKNVKMHFGNSVNVLPLIAKKDSIIFGDAHWLHHNPLLEELAILMNIRPKVIVIHDFKVPDHPEFGYDIYPNITYEWDAVKDHIHGYDHYYNEKATGAMRGYIVLTLKTSVTEPAL